MKQIKWGILGAGSIAQKFVNDFRLVKDARLMAIGSRSIERAEAFAESNNLEKAYGSYEELARDKDIEVVYVASPHTSHLTNSILCMKHGKAVLCEKPIAVNTKELDIMLSAARANNVFLMEAMWTWFLPPLIKAKEWVENGRIGKIMHLKAEFGFKAEVDFTHRVFNPDLAGGALLDVGIYPLAFAQYFMDDEPLEIKASGHIGQSGVDEFTSIHLKFSNHVLAELSSSITAKFENKGIIYGEKGKIVIPDFWQCREALLFEDGQSVEIFGDHRSTRGYNYEAEAVNASLRAGLKMNEVVSWAKSQRLMRWMDVIRTQIGLIYPFE